MTNHPLTDEMIEKIEMRFGGPCERCNNDMNMRAAADWQLEQVIEWLKANLMKRHPDDNFVYIYDDYTRIAEIEMDLLIKDLRQAIRPQQQENN